MKRLVHDRKIAMRTFDLGDHFILVEGNLIDHRHWPRDKKASEQPGIVHDMVIRLKIKGPEMSIEEAEAAMPHHPNEECPAVIPGIRNLQGLRIAPGFTMKVKRAIGGTKGCAHLTSLVLAMGEEAVQGYWSAYGEERGKLGLRAQEIKNLINTCHLWREDGPIVKGFRERGEA